MNTAAVERPALLTEAACTYGAQCVVASIDAARDDDRWLVCVRGGRERTTRDAIEWAQECADRGAGEILLTSVDRRNEGRVRPGAHRCRRARRVGPRDRLGRLEQRITWWPH